MTFDKSLKTVLQSLSETTGVPWPTLYEHQKSLVQEGLLKPRPGRGPGSGVLATPEVLVLFFVTFMAKRNAREMVQIENAVLNSKQVD